MCVLCSPALSHCHLSDLYHLLVSSELTDARPHRQRRPRGGLQRTVGKRWVSVFAICRRHIVTFRETTVYCHVVKCLNMFHRLLVLFSSLFSAFLNEDRDIYFLNSGKQNKNTLANINTLGDIVARD